MIRAALCSFIVATAAHAGPTMEIGQTSGIRGPSTVTIAPTDQPGALAEITFNNVSINDAADTGTTGTIDLNGIEVGVTFAWEVDVHGSDEVTLTPPDGVICVPSCVMTVPEDTPATVTLYSQQFEGF